MQLALLAGCHVVATCGSAIKAERLRSLGVHRVINYKEEVPAVVLCCTLETACVFPCLGLTQIGKIAGLVSAHRMLQRCSGGSILGRLMWHTRELEGRSEMLYLIA